MIKEEKIKQIRKSRRVARTRKGLKESGKIRLSIFRSNKYLYAQIIDDSKGITLASASEKELGKEVVAAQRPEELGKLIAKKALEKKVKQVVFDKGAYKFHGKVKSFAEGSRKEGLIF